MIGAHPDDERSDTSPISRVAALSAPPIYLSPAAKAVRTFWGRNKANCWGSFAPRSFWPPGASMAPSSSSPAPSTSDSRKTAEETFAKWGRDRILSDIVWIVRRFRPDVIMLCFSGTPRDGHGQHQVSSILGKEAFFAAADRSRFPEQLKWVQPWQAKRVVWNVLTGRRSRRRPGPDRYGRVQPDPGLFLRRDRRDEPEHASQPGHGHRWRGRLRYQFLRAHGRRACFQRPVRWHRYDLGPGAGRGRGSFAPPRAVAFLRPRRSPSGWSQGSWNSAESSPPLKTPGPLESSMSSTRRSHSVPECGSMPRRSAGTSRLDLPARSM